MSQREYMAAYADLLEVVFIEASTEGVVTKSFGGQGSNDFVPEQLVGGALQQLLNPDAYQQIFQALAGSSPRRVLVESAVLTWQQHGFLFRISGKNLGEGWALALLPLGKAEVEEEWALQESDMFRMAVEDAYDGICITSDCIVDPHMVYVNESFCQHTGYSPEELIGRNPKLLQGKDTDPTEIASLREALSLGTAWKGKTFNYRKDGSRYFVEWHMSPLRTDEGEIVSPFGMTVRVTIPSRILLK